MFPQTQVGKISYVLFDFSSQVSLRGFKAETEPAALLLPKAEGEAKGKIKGKAKGKAATSERDRPRLL